SALLRAQHLPPHRGLLRALTAAPFLLALSSSTVQALEVISLLLNIPNIEPILQSLLLPLRAQCEALLTPDAAQAAWERGQALDLNETAQQLLNRLHDERS